MLLFPVWGYAPIISWAFAFVKNFFSDFLGEVAPPPPPAMNAYGLATGFETYSIVMRNLSHAHGLICLVVRWAVPVGKDIVSRRFQNVNNFFIFFQKIFLAVFGKHLFTGADSRPGPSVARIFIYILYKATRRKKLGDFGKKIFLSRQNAFVWTKKS